MIVEPLPGLTWTEALTRLAAAPWLVALHAGDDGPAYLAAATDAATTRLTDSGAAGSPAHGRHWTLPRDPHRLIQIDYESRRPDLDWSPRAWLTWEPQDSDVPRLYALDHAAAAALRSGLERPASRLAPLRLAGRLTPAWDEEGHIARVQRLQEAIRAGEIYQANLTLAFSGRLAAHAQADAALFLALVERSPAPFAGLFRAPGRASLVSHSPECFLARGGEHLISRPIKGTSSRQPGQDEATRRALAGSVKERAELAMIIDLMRNDLSPHARPGSVRVSEDAAIIDLPYVHHLVGTVHACMAPGASFAEVLTAALPPGSVTGCPKRRAIDLIRAVEGGPRGAYCGAFGWIGAEAAELAVAIRCALISDDSIRIHAGGGITADSDPAAEWREAVSKTSGLRSVLESVCDH